MSHLIPPHGGTLVDPIVTAERAAELKAASRDMPSWDLLPRQLEDVELLLTGAYSPLSGFMTRAEHDSVVSGSALPGGTFWPVPITLDVAEELASTLQESGALALRDREGVMLAVLGVTEVWECDPLQEAHAVWGTTSLDHPGSARTQAANPWRVGGLLEGIHPPTHYDYVDLRATPMELRQEFTRLGWRDVVAYHPSGPMHRAEYELSLRAAADAGSNLLLHAMLAKADPGDADHYATVRALQAFIERYPLHTAKLALLPMTRLPDERHAGLRAIVARNYGCNAVLGDGIPQELGVRALPATKLHYVADRDEYAAPSDVQPGARVLSIDEGDLHRRLDTGAEIPSWFTFPEVAVHLRAAHPPRSHQGFCVFFTGLSGSGKSTIANVLNVKLLEMGGRPVTVLDGDIVRKHLSSELGFSKEDRNLNIQRIGFVASEITKNGGIAICAPIAPYDETRKRVRAMVGRRSGFVLVHVATPLAVCEERDRKGLYARARAGLQKGVTGIDDPYEAPSDAEITIDTQDCSPEEATQQIVLYLERAGFISGAQE